MNPLKQAQDDEDFERRLAENLALSPADKRKRLNQVDAMAKKPCHMQDEPGQRFDVLEYQTDVPIIPCAGSRLPSQVFFKQKG